LPAEPNGRSAEKRYILEGDANDGCTRLCCRERSENDAEIDDDRGPSGTETQ
jgi:hypothetical protein